MKFAVVRYAAFVDLFQTLRQLRIVFERLLLNACALLRLLVPLAPHLPPRHLARLPREGLGHKGYAQLLAVGGHRTFRVPDKVSRVHDRRLFPALQRETKQPVLQLVAGLLQGEVWPKPVQRGDYGYGVANNEGVSEARDKLRRHDAFGVEGYVLEVHASLPGLE